MELLSVINNTNKYNINNILNEKIAIVIKNIEDFTKVQLRIKETYPHVNILDEETYIKNIDSICINVEEFNTDSLHSRICWCYERWYIDHNYEVIEVEDLIWQNY